VKGTSLLALQLAFLNTAFTAVIEAQNPLCSFSLFETENI
jgi:hypothetical protein